MKNLMTIKEVADCLRVCPHTIARAVREGKLKSVRLGKRLIRYEPREVARWLKIDESDLFRDDLFDAPDGKRFDRSGPG